MKKNLKKYKNEKQDNQVSKKQSSGFNLKREIEKLPEPARSYYRGGLFAVTYGSGTQQHKEKQYKQITKQVKAYIKAGYPQSGRIQSKGNIGQEIPRKVGDGVQSKDWHYIEADISSNEEFGRHITIIDAKTSYQEGSVNKLHDNRQVSKGTIDFYKQWFGY